MNEEHEKSALRTRITRARGHQASIRRNLLQGLFGAVLLAAVGGGGVWLGLRLDRETPPAPAPAGTPAPTLPRTESPPAGQTSGSASTVEDQPALTSRGDESPPFGQTPGSASIAEDQLPQTAEDQTPTPGGVESPPAGHTPGLASTATESRLPQAVEDRTPAPEGVESPPAGSIPEPDRGDGRPAPAHEAASAGDPARSAASKHVQFEEMLSRLEQALRSAPAGASPSPEHEAALERIRLGKEKALEARDAGDTDSALRLLTDAERETEELARNEEARYRTGLQAARDAYAAGNPAAARRHVDRVLEQRPGDPEATRWEARIARLPELLAERRKAEDARRAGNLHEERAALRRVLEIEPEETGAGSRIQAIDRRLHEQAFARAIAQGRRAVEEGALEPAKQALAEAERREPQHAETGQFRTQVAALERTLTRDRHLAAAEQAAANDDWEAALRAFEEARAVDPTHDAAVNGGRLAARLVNAQRAVDEYLSRPDRLGSPGVAAAARETLSEASASVALSAWLASSAKRLENAIEAAQTPVPVRILSDEQTEIGIRGVGTVGLTRERTIELVPGRYVFEGKRRGYRSKLVEVVVQANPVVPVEVRIVCDERS